MSNRSNRTAQLQAYAVMKRLEKPEGWSDRKWNGVERFLWVIARRQPKCYPSEAALAAQLRVTERTIQNYVRWAKEAGLLEVWYDAGVSRRGNPAKTSRYFVSQPQSGPSCQSVPETSSGAVPETSSGKEPVILTYHRSSKNAPSVLNTSC